MVGRAVRVSKRKSEPLKELFGDRGRGGEVRGEKEIRRRVEEDDVCARERFRWRWWSKERGNNLKIHVGTEGQME